jgi:NAD(P)-dependent dehydrogenase (short-subunit alcohol dehydrogenase family)
MSSTSRVAVVTGASSGLGKVVAKALAAQGWRVIGTGRDAARMASAQAEIRAAAPEAEVELLRADLSLIAEADRLADDIAARTDRIDLLVNNAGGMSDRLVMTSEGLEENFAANHLGPFALTDRLLPLLRAAAKGAPAGSVRILMTASNAGEYVPGLNLDDLQNLANYDVGTAYCYGKLANIMFARALGERLAGDGIVAHSVHPGRVGTNFGSTASETAQAHIRAPGALSEDEGADTLIWLATSPEGGQSTGGYWFERQPRTRDNFEDAATLERFWEESEKLVASARP